MIRVFGAAAYPNMITQPFRLISRAAEIEGERDAEQQLHRLRLMAVADGMEQGKVYVPDPNDPPSKSRAHYNLQPYNQTLERLERQAYPWAAEAVQRQRRVAEQEAKWQALREAMGLKN
ncbi:hypothetical protein [Deinococcus sp. NW-56]|uniref:hypothetical protein n=1 Tax=Deinococcus sp. NW-56 TaxID=2080419 RepID=UPI000CF48628|nr:hypothetical protein [Deinococcus sp. NW-56]